MNSIFEVLDWTNTVEWKTNDIVKYNNEYYYALRDVNIGETFSENIFGGYFYSLRRLPHFLWKPSFGSNMKENISVRTTEFGRIVQISKDLINNSSLEIDLSFTNRDNNESKAILHFLNARKGTESFYFTPPYPYNDIRIFKCEKWNYDKKFSNSNNIQARFIQKFN